MGAVYEKEGEWFARLHYDHSGNIPPMSGIYDRADQRMYVKKEAEQGIYWLEYEKGTYSLKSRAVTLKEKRELEGEVLLEENTLDHAAVCCQPVYECYKEGEILLDVQGNPIPEMEQVPVYEEKEVVYQTLAKELWRPCGMHPQAAIRSIYSEIGQRTERTGCISGGYG